MANMSYCRMENTVNDMWDCLEALQEGKYNDLEDVSRLELAAMEDMLSMIEDLKWELKSALENRE